MRKMIDGYLRSCRLTRERIAELTKQKNNLMKQGSEDLIEELDLERRIRLLYSECSDMEEIIRSLTSYMRRVEQRGKT